MPDVGKTLVVAGLVLAAIGLVVTFAGRLPGDIVIEKERFTFYFPLTTSLIVSTVLSLLFYLFWH